MTRHSLPLYLLLAAALLMRAVLPQGYMPERSDSGAIAVVLCSSGGVHLIPLKDDGPAPDKSQRAEPPCAFAGLAMPTLPPLAPELVAPTALAIIHPENSASGAAPVATRLHPPARGPPVAA